MPDHEPVVTSTVTITEGPTGITRSWSATVSGGTSWERAQLRAAALAEAEFASWEPYMAARHALGDRRAKQHQMMQIVAMPNGYVRNPDPQEGA